jgi:hypothetical protein
MSYQGVFGNGMERDEVRAMNRPMAMPVMSGYVGGVVGGVMGGSPQGQQGAAWSELSRKAAPPPAPSPKQAISPPPTTPAKLDAVIAAVIQRVKSGARPSVDEARFVFGDRAYIRVTLSDASPATIEQLRNAGFVVTKTEGNVLVGHVALASLEALSKLPMVTAIAPR